MCSSVFTSDTKEWHRFCPCWWLLFSLAAGRVAKQGSVSCEYRVLAPCKLCRTWQTIIWLGHDATASSTLWCGRCFCHGCRWSVQEETGCWGHLLIYALLVWAIYSYSEYRNWESGVSRFYSIFREQLQILGYAYTLYLRDPSYEVADFILIYLIILAT